MLQAWASITKALLLISLPLSAAVSYSYDSAGRLSKVDYGNGTVIIYAYDKAGNMTSRQVAGTGSSARITSVVTASGGSAIAQNTFIEIHGTNLVPATTPATGVIWSSAPSFASGQMPTQLNGVSATINGKPGFIYFFCSAATKPVCATDQLNVLTPLDSTVGQVQVVTTSPSGSSAPFTVKMQAVSPAFLLFSGGYVAATHSDGSLLAPASLYPGSSTPAKPNEMVNLYAVGFGLPTTPLVNGSVMQGGSLPALPVCQIGNQPATVNVAVLISPGLYAINVTVPASAANGDNSISCTYGGSATPSGDLITVQQ